MKVPIRKRLPTIYLCGQITGKSPSEAKGWRRKVRTALEGQARVIDPVRDCPDNAIQRDRPLTATRLLHGKATVTRDRFDVRRSDIVLACFLGARRVSIGAVGEIFWADAFRKPVIIVREENNVHNHDMLNEMAGWIFEDLDAAIDQVKKLICPA